MKSGLRHSRRSEKENNFKVTLHYIASAGSWSWPVKVAADCWTKSKPGKQTLTGFMDRSQKCSLSMIRSPGNFSLRSHVVCSQEREILFVIYMEKSLVLWEVKLAFIFVFGMSALYSVVWICYCHSRNALQQNIRCQICRIFARHVIIKAKLIATVKVNNGLQKGELQDKNNALLLFFNHYLHIVLQWT